MSFIRNALMTTGLTLALSTAAVAGPIYSFDIDMPPGSEAAGDIKNISTSYDTNTEVFDWSYTIGEKNGGFSDGFWLVVTDGENPKGDKNEYVILYGDLDNNILTAYEYNGQNSSNSWNNSSNAFLGSFDNAFTINDNAGMRTVDFSVDATNMNNAANHAELDGSVWKGLNYAEKIGVWFHPSLNTTVGYDNDGKINQFSKGSAGWYDTGNKDTTSVPEPQTLLIFAIGLLGFSASRKFRRA